MTTETILGSVHVRWSAAESAFVARSDRYPELIHRNEWSSLAAVDGLLSLIDHHHAATRRPAA
ncbi:hypothetical protein NDR87_10175 [Nocardia sp. CDC159]|uniref:Uncharacterized protein n=1 Tax=Nocardia pulmonis TaxID=2951408 RepID=A0A9X2E414_9NOCA|nr:MULTISPECIES: hypothetical protein [Nocardia]MCM6773834.1 hypothetical protein [Nocardia pulmonis]MCM6786721.1 hypothetical protein [Nocardia sp. CDC159]